MMIKNSNRPCSWQLFPLPPVPDDDAVLIIETYRCQLLSIAWKTNSFSTHKPSHSDLIRWCSLDEMQCIAFRLMVSSRVLVCVCVCMCVWTSAKRFEIETSFFFKLRGITPDIICKSLTQIGLQIPRWRTKWRPWNTI